jgi:hypothetical protein
VALKFVNGVVILHTEVPGLQGPQMFNNQRKSLCFQETRPEKLTDFKDDVSTAIPGFSDTPQKVTVGRPSDVALSRVSPKGSHEHMIQLFSFVLFKANLCIKWHSLLAFCPIIAQRRRNPLFNDLGGSQSQDVLTLSHGYLNVPSIPRNIFSVFHISLIFSISGYRITCRKA